MITKLKDNEVFVFGSNEDGFHGAGAAGFACRGDYKNNWREDTWFVKSLKTSVGSKERIGKWAVLGVARGFQEGREGKSYAIQTIIKPGQKQSVSLEQIYFQLVKLWKFIETHPELDFLIAKLGENYAGWSHEEMEIVWKRLIKRYGSPFNVKFV